MKERKAEQEDFACQIGDSILSYLRTENICNNTSSNNINLSLYNGLSGLAFYLLQLYNVTEKNKYLNDAIEICDWIGKKDFSDNNQNISFYSGLGGVAFVFVNMYRTLGNEEYLLFAKKILFARRDNYNSSYDIFSGTAGEILSLLHLHSELREEWIIIEIEKRVNYLLKTVTIKENGFCWGIRPDAIQPLCGFSHGVSGIAFVFLELSRYFNNETFYLISELAFEYEDHFWNNDAENWPDFRQDIYSKGAIDIILKHENIEEAITPSYLAFWCHGAPGIGIAHLHSYLHRKKNAHLKYIWSAVKRTIASVNMTDDYSLCHGLSGNLTLLIEFNQFADGQLDGHIKKICDSFLCVNNGRMTSTENLQDLGLFLSSIGIGYFFLRLSNPDKVFPILLPVVRFTQTNKALYRFSNEQMLESLFGNLFVNTAKKVKIDRGTFVYDSQKNIIDNIYHTLKNIAQNDSSFWLKLDLERLAIIKSTANYTSYYIYCVGNNKQIEKLNGDSRLVRNIFIKVLSYDEFGKRQYILLRPSYVSSGVNQYEMDEFTFNIISSFSSVSSISQSQLAMRKTYFDKPNFDMEYMKIIAESVRTKVLIGVA